MLTCFSSTFSERINSVNLFTSVLVGPYAKEYYCVYYDHDALANANVHFTSASDTTSKTNCRNLNVYRIKGSGFLGFSLDYDKNINFPYTGSILLYIMKYSEGQQTNYNGKTIDIKTLPLYTDSGDVVFHNRFFSSSNIPRTYTVDIRFDVGTEIAIKPSQRLRCCVVCFFGHQRLVRNVSIDLTTTVFYNGN